jgi:peptidyl-tRNA hydrolase, PTH1 family
MQVVVGLGNPGSRYAGTRHNAGFLVVDRLAERRRLLFTKQRQALVARDGDLILAKPTTFMNLSGAAVQALMTRHAVRREGLLLVHDDLDLPLGRLRIRHGGGSGGQRGVQDTIDRIGPGFARLRIGISRPPDDWPAERWVLSRFAESEAPLVERTVDAAADAVLRWLSEGLEAAQRWANGLDLAAPEPSHEPPHEPPPEAPPGAPFGASGGGRDVDDGSRLTEADDEPSS